MHYRNTTQVPNTIFDLHLPSLKEAELKILLVIIRQTVGWIDVRTGNRKERDRICISQFRQKTGLSSRSITKALQALSEKNLIVITGFKGETLSYSCDRKGKKYLFYQLSQHAHILSKTNAHCSYKPAHKTTYDKTNFSKPIATKPVRPADLVKKYALLHQRDAFPLKNPG